MVSGGPARSDSPSIPDPEFLRRLRRHLASRYRLQPADLDDVINQSMVDYMRALKDPPTRIDGLFVVIARRRAYDLWKRGRNELPLGAARAALIPPNREHLERELLERMVRRFCARHPRFDAGRLFRLAHGLLTGDSFPAACRAAGIPRGSQGRYRNALKICFKDVPTHVLLDRRRRIDDLGPSVKLRGTKRGGKNEARDR